MTLRRRRFQPAEIDGSAVETVPATALQKGDRIWRGGGLHEIVECDALVEGGGIRLIYVAVKRTRISRSAGIAHEMFFAPADSVMRGKLA